MNIFLQYILPHYYINKLAKTLANCKIIFIKNFLINWFIKNYKINMLEAEEIHPLNYKTYNDFFVRKLKDSARNHPEDQLAIISPSDGIITQYGSITNNILLTVKNTNINLNNLLLDQNTFANGKFINIYLAPHNYHRVHMPCSAVLEKMIYIPGKLFAVNPKTVSCMPDVFTKNERVVAIFDSDFGKIAMVLVGAMIVGSIVTSWHGAVNPVNKAITTWDYANNPVKLLKFAEMGLFQLGSTVIVVFANNKINFDPQIKINQEIKVGDQIARI
jgi:phosphatidylserine decarboxylase